jgi:hypothetical protein
MRRLTWVSGSFPAHVLAARLRSEGIDCELRGAIDSPYGLTVGAMARVDVYVPEDQMEDAQLVMLVGEVDATLAAPGEWAHAGEDVRPRRWPMWTAVILLVCAGLGPVLVHLAR